MNIGAGEQITGADGTYIPVCPGAEAAPPGPIEQIHIEWFHKLITYFSRRNSNTNHVKNEQGWRWWQESSLRALNRRRRDVRETTKYIETALVIDKAMFDRRNGSTRAEVVHDAIQVANIADLVSALSHCFK